MLSANLPVRKALGHFQPAGAFCKSACEKSSWPLSTRCDQRVNLHSDKAKCCLATFNQHYHFACKNALGHFHPSKHFAISSMCRKAKSPVTVCGNSRNVTFYSLERQNRKWPLSATDRSGWVSGPGTDPVGTSSATTVPHWVCDAQMHMHPLL